MNDRPPLPPPIDPPPWAHLYRPYVPDGVTVRDLLPIAAQVAALERGAQERERETLEIKGDIRHFSNDLGNKIAGMAGAIRAELHSAVATTEGRQLARIDNLEDKIGGLEERLGEKITTAVQSAAHASRPRERELELMGLIKLALLLVAAALIGADGLSKIFSIWGG